MAHKLHPLLTYMRKQKPRVTYRAAGMALGCHFTTVRYICTRRHEPTPELARRIVVWSRGAVTMDKLYGGK